MAITPPPRQCIRFQHKPPNIAVGILVRMEQDAQLVQANADPNGKDLDGQTPVKWADMQANDDMIRYLQGLGGNTGFSKVLTLYAVASES